MPKRSSSSDIDQLVARLASWKGGALWFTERVVIGEASSFAQQGFKLTRAAWEGKFISVQARWGHDLTLFASKITQVEMDDRAVSATERLAPGVERVSRFSLLALRDDARTNIGDAAHVIFHPHASLLHIGATTALSVTLEGDTVVAPAAAPTISRSLTAAVRSWADRPIVFWVGASARERLALWRACDLIVTAKLKPIAWFCGPSGDPDAEMSLGVLPPDQLAHLHEQAHPLSPKAIRFFASQWRSVVRGHRPKTGTIDGWPSSHDWALGVPADFDAAFPRRAGRVTFLSRLDTELLAPFKSAWSSPVDVLRRDYNRWRTVMALLPADGPPERLAEWAKVEGGRYLESRAGPKAEREWLRFEYRLTRAGRALLRDGTERGDLLPKFSFVVPSP